MLGFGFGDVSDENFSLRVLDFRFYGFVYSEYPTLAFFFSFPFSLRIDLVVEDIKWARLIF